MLEKEIKRVKNAWLWGAGLKGRAGDCFFAL